MDQRYTLETLIQTLGPTQIQAMFWRLENQNEAATDIETEFSFITEGNFPNVSNDGQTTFLRKLRDNFVQHLGNVRSQQAIVKRSIQSTSTVTEDTSS